MNKKTKMKEFYELLDKIGKNEEVQSLKIFIKNEILQKKVIDFIKVNNIDCNYLWEDSEQGHSSTIDWHKLIEYCLDLLKEYKNKKMHDFIEKNALKTLNSKTGETVYELTDEQVSRLFTIIDK